MAERSPLEQLRDIRQIIHCEENYHVGDIVDSAGSLRQVHFRFHIICGTDNEMAEIIKRILDTIVVLDDAGESMIVNTIRPEQAIRYWG